VQLEEQERKEYRVLLVLRELLVLLVKLERKAYKEYKDRQVSLGLLELQALRLQFQDQQAQLVLQEQRGILEFKAFRDPLELLEPLEKRVLKAYKV
jgi:hypothetical protein